MDSINFLQQIIARVHDSYPKTHTADSWEECPLYACVSMRQVIQEIETLRQAKEDLDLTDEILGQG